MTKGQTVELDDAQDLVDEELEIFERESLEAESRVQTADNAPRTAGNTTRGSTRTANTEPDKTMISRQTQTVQSSLAAPATPASHTLMKPVDSVNTVTNVRTLTRQLRAGGRWGSVKRAVKTLPAKAPLIDDVDDDEEAEDDFYQIEAGTSNSRKVPPKLGAPLHSGPPGKGFMSTSFKKLNRSLSRTFTLSRLPRINRPSARRGVRRDNKRANLNWFKLMIYDLKVAIEHQRHERHEFKLFLKTIKGIQGELGSSTAALFQFVRYLLMLNLFSSLFWIGFVVIPQAYQFDYASIADPEDPFSTLQLFLGDGRVADSWLFFKGYSETIPKYDMYLAYILIHFISSFGVFICIFKGIGSDIIREGRTQSDNEKSLAMNVFTRWDYSITSHDAIKKQQKSLQSNFKDLICELTSLHKARTKKEIRIIYGLRSLAWFIWVLLVGGAITAIATITSFANNSGKTGFLNVYGPTISLTVINSAVPFLMQQLTKIESYEVGRTEQYVTIFRVYVMRMISLCTFIITLIRADQEGCAQLYWGQEFYKLCIINTISNTAVLLKYPAFDYLLGKKVEVDLPSSLMSLIYFQGCIWFGNLFCPLLSFMAAISNLIYFGVGAIVIKKCCTPPTKRYNSQNSMFFNTFLAATIIIMMAISCFLIVKKPVNCGPYASAKFTYMFDAFTVMAKDWPARVTTIINVVISPAVVVPILFILVIAIWLLQIMNEKQSIKNKIMASEISVLRVEKGKFLKEKKRDTPSPNN